jgi:two-component system, NarL family, invasion response regulator UvrY
VAEQLADSPGCREGETPPQRLLSGRELQGFLRLAQGETVGRAAQELSLSVRTLGTVRSPVMDRLGLASNGDLTSCALKTGLVT